MREYIYKGLRFQFSDEDAERLGAIPVETSEAPKPANKSRKARVKADES